MVYTNLQFQTWSISQCVPRLNFESKIAIVRKHQYIITTAISHHIATCYEIKHTLVSLDYNKYITHKKGTAIHIVSTTILW